MKNKIICLGLVSLIFTSLPAFSMETMARPTPGGPLRTDGMTLNRAGLMPVTGQLNFVTFGGTPPYNYFAHGTTDGRLVVYQNGTFVFIPTHQGVSTFQYVVFDINRFYSNIGTVTINIE